MFICQSDSTIEDLLSTMVSRRVRRVFMVDNAKDCRPKHVITASDLCGAIRRELVDRDRDAKAALERTTVKSAPAKKAKGKSAFVKQLEQQANKKGGKKASWEKKEKKKADKKK